MTDAPLELDRLLAEAVWLERLALHLVGDAAEAEDVVQETWIAALRAPRAALLVSPRAWLAEVVRRVTAGRRRGDTRRRDRERGRGDDPVHAGLGGADVVSARLELQRVVGEELERLPEPYRSALFLQYYEGLSPQEIAARSGEPAGTVRWRSKRGRELLREALVARDGRAWETWALALAPIAGVTPEVGASIAFAAAPAAIAAMSKWISLSAVAGVLAALGLRVTLHAIDPPPTTSEARVDATPATAHPLAATSGAQPIGAPTGPVGARAAVDVVYTGPVLGRGRLRSTGAGPLEDGELSFVAEDGREVEAFVTNSAWAAPDLAPGRWRIEATAKGHMETSLDVDVPAAAVWTRDVELLRTGVLPVRIEALDGNDLPPTRLAPNRDNSMFTVHASAEPIPLIVPRKSESWFSSPAGRWTPRETWRSTMPHLDPRYQGELALEEPPPLHVALVFGRHVVARGTTSAGDTELVFRIDETMLMATTGSVEVTTLDETTGAPAYVRGELELVDGYGATSTSFLSRSGPSFVANGVPAGDYILTLGGEWAPVVARISVRPGERTVLPDVRLRATTQVEVRIDGLPDEVGQQRNALLEVRASMPGLAPPFAAEWVQGSMHDARSFRLSTAPVGAVDVRLRLPGGRRFVFPPQRIDAGRNIELSFAAGRLEEGKR